MANNDDYEGVIIRSLRVSVLKILWAFRRAGVENEREALLELYRDMTLRRDIIRGRLHVPWGRLILREWTLIVDHVLELAKTQTPPPDPAVDVDPWMSDLTGTSFLEGW